jgi:hypothetical protein
MAQIFVILMVLIMTVFSSVSTCSLPHADSSVKTAAAQPSPTVNASAAAEI